MTMTTMMMISDGERRGWGEMYIYFGCRQASMDDIYRDEISLMKSLNVLTEDYLALSREEGKPKVRLHRAHYTV